MDPPPPPPEQQQQHGDENVNNVEVNEEALKLFQQFRTVFGTEIGTNLYYALNSDDDDSDEVAHIRIEQMMAEMNELTDSSDNTSKTTTTVISPDSNDSIEQAPSEEIIITSPTSSSSLYAIRTPSPPSRTFMKYHPHLEHHSKYRPQHQMFSQSDSEDEGVTLTEIVEIHRVPSVALITLDNNNLSHPHPPPYHSSINNDEVDLDIETHINNNNTSCSLSSTLTDSKTLDIRTPIVV